MESIMIMEDLPLKDLLNEIENSAIKENKKFVILEFGSCVNHEGCRKIIEEIKGFFDIFLILKTSLPSERNKIETYFSYGVHGIYFSSSSDSYSEEEMEVIRLATEIFPNGLVFAESKQGEGTIDRLLKERVIPIIDTREEHLVEYILNHEDHRKVMTKDVLKYIPIYHKPITLSLTDKIKFKMVLEGINLRQKLMIKKVAESFNSSGL